VKATLKAEGRSIVPITVFPKGAHYALEVLAKAQVFDLISLDWTMDPKQARNRLNGMLSVMID
jgi:uroporphyrinogen decarboxylase